ncbi:MAG: hypothetical protein Q4A31_01985 [Corynebacterium sp.]|uniref:hypothetical protein n=1 Tax=Corynebacterium sp. TaxID=1720 RepID=UPI0026DD8DB0|nr:hypothetical protein [Corynebacterium sp.]MDO4760676.1 hypothetical protein [Corynebacterium sp.]
MDNFKSYLMRCKVQIAISFALTLIIVFVGFALFFFSRPDEALEYGAFSLLFFPFVRELIRRYRLAQDRLGLVEITEAQFPKIYYMVEELVAEAGLEKMPPIYLTSKPSVDPCTVNPGLRKAIIIGTDFVSGCEQYDAPEALRFMLAHHVGHFVAGHNKNMNIWVSAASMSIPVFRTLLVRSLEFTADYWAATRYPVGAQQALALCATGRDNFVHVNCDELVRNHETKIGKLSKIARWETYSLPAPERLAHVHKINQHLKENNR